jgi:DNA-binding transcriptional regulator YiaG
VTIRYQRSATGYRVERVPASVPSEGTEPWTQPVEAAAEEALREGAAAMRDTAAALHAFAAALRADLARQRRLFPKAAPAREARAVRVRTATVRPEDVAFARGLVPITQRALAEHLHVSRSALAEAERGRRSISEGLARWTEQVLRAKGLLPRTTPAGPTDPAASGDEEVSA